MCLFLCFSTLYQPTCFCIPIYMLLYVHIVCKFFCACLCLSTCFWCPRPPLHVFVCTPSQMVTLCLFGCPVNIRTLDDCSFSFPGYKYRSRRLQNIVSTVACCHAHTRPLSVSGHALGEPFFTRFYRTVTSCIKTAFFAETTPEVAVMVIHACVFSQALFLTELH